MFQGGREGAWFEGEGVYGMWMVIGERGEAAREGTMRLFIAGKER